MRHSTERFTHNKGAKMFVAEISDLGGNVFGQIYPDARDLGIILVSDKTGAETKWAMSREMRNWEGDLDGWVLIPIAETLRKTPALLGYEVHILND